MKQRDLVMREKKKRHIFPPTLESHVDFMLLSAQWKCFCPNSPWSERGEEDSNRGDVRATENVLFAQIEMMNLLSMQQSCV